jgi:hypothetical protein
MRELEFSEALLCLLFQIGKIIKPLPGRRRFYMVRGNYSETIL